MKSLSLLAIVASCCVLLPLACTQDKSSPEPVVGRPIQLSARVASQTTGFAFDLLSKIDETEPAEDNVFVSPLSLHIALGMLLNGAEGETRDGILKTLRADASSVTELNEAYKTLLKELPAADNKVKLAIANSMWSRQGFSVKGSFKEVLAGVFSSEIYSEPFDATTVRKINQWASDNTQGKIEQVIDNINSDLVMFLMNALYFKGDWKYTFDKGQTKDWNFQLDGGSEKQVKMMFVESDLRSYSNANYSAVELPYSSGQFNLTFFVPHSGKNLSEVIQNFDQEEWESVQQRLTKTGVKAGLPKFTMDYEIQLKNVLSQMGMAQAFGPGAELRGIADADLEVGFVKQNTFLGVDEEGTEAAAVTTIGIVLTSVGPGTPQTIIADKPFFFVISENTSNTILFTGKIVNP